MKKTLTTSGNPGLLAVLAGSLLYLLILAGCQAPEEKYETFMDYPVYDGDDLGLRYSAESSKFRVWAPTSTELKLAVYDHDMEGEPSAVYDMQKDEQGTWVYKVDENLKGKFYTFQAMIDGEWKMEVPDPYSISAGTNGKRAAVVDLNETDPEGWETDKAPVLKNFTDAVIYEIHVRDLSVHPESGIENKGKFLGFTETSTTGPGGISTGLDHIADLGVTHIHLLPSYDFASIDESKLEDNRFNWGYDPRNYNIPEGSYSSDPSDPVARVLEFKEMVMSLHQKGIRFIMDVVYNHTYDTLQFNQLVPGYYYRQNEDGSYSDAAACGNEVASERPMVRKMIVESVKYWAEEYHVDGFRFDLMGILDIETMNEVRRVLDEVDPSIIVYGEGWTAGSSPLPDEKRALKQNVPQLDRIAAFSDEIRDGLKGNVFDDLDTGFVSGKLNMEESVKFGIVGGIEHPQLDLESVNYTNVAWAGEPEKCINYVSCHDNHTLWDKLVVSKPGVDLDRMIKMHVLSNTIVMTAQGIPFLHAGVDFLRTKSGEHNSYQSPDSVNMLDWQRKQEFLAIHEFYQKLIGLRKNHPGFRMASSEQVFENLQFLQSDNQLITFKINGEPSGDIWKEIFVIHNGGEGREVEIPEGDWDVVLDGMQINEKGIRKVENKVKVAGISSMILAR